MTYKQLKDEFNILINYVDPKMNNNFSFKKFKDYVYNISNLIDQITIQTGRETDTKFNEAKNNAFFFYAKILNKTNTSEDRMYKFFKAAMENLITIMNSADTSNIKEIEKEMAPTSVSNIENAPKEPIIDVNKNDTEYYELNNDIFTSGTLGTKIKLDIKNKNETDKFIPNIIKLVFEYGNILNKSVILNFLSLAKDPMVLVQGLNQNDKLKGYDNIDKLLRLFFIKVPFFVNATSGEGGDDTTKTNTVDRYIYNASDQINSKGINAFINVNNVVSDTIVLRQFLIANYLHYKLNDTTKLNKINSNNQVIFIGTLIKSLIDIVNDKQVSDNLLSSFNHNYENKLLYIYLYNNILQNLVEINKILILNDTDSGISTSLERKYIEYYNKNSSVLSFIKVRQDTDKSNPRFDIKPTQNNGLIVNYYNFPGKLGSGKDNEVKPIVTQEMKDNKETYLIGPINKYFDKQSITNEDIAKDKLCGETIKIKIEAGENIVVIGNGQSGAGKTSTLINLFNTTTNKNEPGILPIICSNLNKDFNKIVIRMLDIYINYDNVLWNKNENLQNEIKQKHNLVKPIIFNGNETIELSRSGEDWINGDKTLGEIISQAFELREIEPTKNNPNSSRSHVLVLLDIYKKNNLHSKFVICDLAGVEDVFTCGGKEIAQLNNNYINYSDKYNQNNPNKEIIKNDNRECNEEYNTKNYKTIKTDDRISYKKNIFDPIKDMLNFINKQIGGSLNCYDTENIDEYMKNYTDFSDDFNQTLNNIPNNDIENQIINYHNPLVDYDKATNIKMIYFKILSNIIEYYDKFDFLQNKNYLKYKLARNNDGSSTLYVDDPAHQSKFNDIDPAKPRYYNRYAYSYDNNKGTYYRSQPKVTLNELIENISLGKLSFDRNIGTNDEIQNKALEFFKKDNLIETLKKYVNSPKNTDLLAILNKIKLKLKDLIRYRELEYNCRVRRVEGYLINNSLKQMQQFINSFIIDKETHKFRENILKNEKDEIKELINPLIHTVPSINFKVDNAVINCNNKDYLYNYHYELFSKKSSSDKISESEIIMKLIFGKDKISTYENKYVEPFSLDKYKTSLVIFTVINLSATNTVNNPPNPPYVNTNKLKQIYNTLHYISANAHNDKSKDIIDYYKKIPTIFSNFITNKLIIHDFYGQQVKNHQSQLAKKITSINMYLNDDTQDEDIKYSKYLNMINNLKEIIEIIDGNNSATLIGTIELNKFSEPRDPKLLYYNCNLDTNDDFKPIYKINYNTYNITSTKKPDNSPKTNTTNTTTNNSRTKSLNL